MKIKVEKYAFGKISDLYINRINCNTENILKVLELFSLKTIVAEISDIQKNDKIFEKIKHFNLKYVTTLEDKSSYFDVVLMANIEQLYVLVNCILESDSEAFSITNIGNEIQWEQYLYNKIPIRKLIKLGGADINISVAIQESAIGITLSNDVYDAKQVTTEIRNLFK